MPLQTPLATPSNDPVTVIAAGDIELSKFPSAAAVTAQDKLQESQRDRDVSEIKRSDEALSRPPTRHVQTPKQKRAARMQFAALCWCMFMTGWNDASTGPLLPRIQEVYNVRLLVYTRGVPVVIIYGMWSCRSASLLFRLSSCLLAWYVHSTPKIYWFTTIQIIGFPGWRGR